MVASAHLFFKAKPTVTSTLTRPSGTVAKKDFLALVYFIYSTYVALNFLIAELPDS